MAFTRDDYLRQFRQDNPNLGNWTDEDVLDQYTETFASDPEKHPFLAQRSAEQRDAAHPWSSWGGYVSDAFSAGTDQAQGKLYGAAALAGDIAGSDWLKEWGDEGFARNQAEANEAYRPLVENFKDIKNAKDFTFWISGLTGTALPQIIGTAGATALAAAAIPEEIIGASAAGAVGLGVRALRLLGAGATTAEGAAAAGLSSKALAGLAGTFIAGATQSQNYEELKAEGGEHAVSLGVLNGLLGGVLQTQGPAASLAKLAGDGVTHSAMTKAALSFFDKVPAPLVRVAVGTAHEGSKNMLISMAQESAALLSEAYSNKDNPDFKLDDQTVLNRMTNAAVSGFMLGGLTGGALGLKGERGAAVAKPNESAPIAEASVAPALASYDLPARPISDSERATAAALTPDLSRFADPAPVAAEVPLASTQATPTSQVELATPASQQVLVQLGMKPEQAMTVPESEARVLIDNARKQIEAKQAADQQVAAQQAEVARQAQIQAASTAQTEQQRQLQIAQQQADARSELAAAQPDRTPTPAAAPVQDQVRQLRARQAAARDFTGTEKFQVKTGGIVGALREQPTPDTMPVATQPGAKTFDIINQAKKNAEQLSSETMRPVEVQKIAAPVTEPTPPVGSEVPAKVTESPQLRTSDATPTPEITPPLPPVTKAEAPLQPFQRDISTLPIKQFLPASKTPSRKAAAEGNSRAPTERYSVFERPDGQVEVRHVTAGARGDPSGRVAVRENQDANPDSIAAAVNKQLGTEISVSKVRGVLDGVREGKFAKEIRDEAIRQGFTEKGNRIDPIDLEKPTSEGGKGYKFVGTIVAEKGERMKHVQTMTAAEFDALVGKVGEVTKLRKTGVTAEVLANLAANPEFDRLLGMASGDKDRITAWKAAAEAAGLKTPQGAPSRELIETAFSEAFTQRAKSKPAPSIEAVIKPTSERPVVEATRPIPAQVEVAPLSAKLDSFLESPSGITRAEQLVRGAPALVRPKIVAALRYLLDPVALERFSKMTREEQNAVVDLTRARLKEKLEQVAAAEDPHQIATDEASREIENNSQNFERRPASDDYRTPDNVTETRFAAGLSDAAARGVTLNLREATSAIKEGGLYDPSKNEVHLTMKNVAAPTRTDFLGLVHEVIHSQTEGQPEWLRTALQDTFARLPVGEKAFYGNPEADPRVATGKNTGNLSREKYLMEQAVEHATLHGVDRQYAQGVIQAVWRTVKDYLLKGAVYLQGAMFGPENAGGTLAKAWVENAAAQFLAGDKTAIDSFLSKIGKKATFAQIRQYTSAGEKTLVHYIDPKTGAPRVDFNHDMSEAGAFYRAGAHLDSAKVELVHSGLQAKVEAEAALRELYANDENLLRDVPDSRKERDLVITNALKNTVSDKRIAIAVANQLHALHLSEFERASKLFPEQERALILKARAAGESVADSLTFKQWLRDHGARNMKDQIGVELKTLEARFADEGTKIDDITKLVHPDLKIDDPGMNKGERVKADEAFLKEATRFQERIAKMQDIARAKITRLQDETETRRARIQSHTKTLRDFQSTERSAITGIVAGLDTLLRKEIPAAERLSETTGYVRAVIESLGEKESNAFDTKFTQKIIDSLDVKDLPLASIFKSLFALEQRNDFTLSEAKPSTIREHIVNEVTANPSSELSRLLKIGEDENASMRGTALLSAILGFAKKEASTVDTIRLQLGDAKTRDAHVNAVRDALAETREASITEIKERVKKDLKSPSNRLISSLLNERDQALADQKSLANAERQSLMLRSTKQSVFASVQAAEQRLKVESNWTLEPGGLVLNPSSPDMPSEQVVTPGNQARLEMSAEKSLSYDQMVDIRHNQKAWLEARADDANKQDITYRTMLHQNDRLSIAMAEHNHVMLSKLKNGWIHNFAEQMNRTGTRPGRLIARMVTSMETIKRGEGSKMTSLGKKAESTGAAFRKAAKLRPEWEHDHMLNPAVDILELATGADRSEGYERVRRNFLTRDETRAFASNPKIWALFEARLDAYAENNLHITAVSLKYGNRVRDEKITRINPATGKMESALRAPIEQGTPGFTSPYYLHADLSAKLATWNHTYAILDKGAKNNPFTDAPLLLRQDPAAFAAKLKTALGAEDIRQLVMDPMIADTENPNVPQPDRADTLKLPVPGDLSAEAWRAADGDLLEYAKQVIQRMGGDGTPEGLLAYQTKLMRHVETNLREISQRAGLERDSDPKLSMFAVKHVGMDARGAKKLKAAWITRKDFSVAENRAALHAIATHGALGRDLSEFRNAAVQVESDLKHLASEMPGTTEERAAFKRKVGAKKFDEVQTAVDQSLKWDAENIEKTLSSELDPSIGATGGGFGLALEIFSTAVTGILFGPRSALKDLSSLAHPFQLERSFSLETVGRTVGVHANLVKYSMATLLNAVLGTDLLRENWQVQAWQRATGGDVSRSTTFSDWMNGNYGKNNAYEKSGYGKAQRLFHLFRDLVTNSRMGFNKDTSGVALRFNLFATSTQLQIMSNVTKYMDATISLAKKTADFYRANPEKIGKTVTAKEIGYGDSHGFNVLKAQMSDYGLSLESVSERLAKKPDMPVETILNDRDIIAINSMVAGRILLEGGPDSRPTFMRGTQFARLNSTFVGWAFGKTAGLSNMLRDEKGRTNLKSLANGAAAMALGLLPAGVAASLLLDQYDDKLLKKKANQIPLYAGMSLEDAARSVGQRLTAMGSFGLPGEVLNGVFNAADGSGQRALSVDQRIVWVNMALQLYKAVSDYESVGGLKNANYANIGRPILGSLGFGGILQNVQLFNGMFSRFNDGKAPDLPGFRGEASVTARINVNNWLRVAGNMTGMEMSKGGPVSVPTPLTPWVTDMVLSALSNDPDGFQKAYKGAILAAQQVSGVTDPMAKVAENFSARNPLKTLFAIRPNEGDVRRMLTAMPDEGRSATVQAIGLLNAYGSRLGVPAYFGAVEKESATSLQRLQGKARGLKPSETSIAALREKAAARRGEANGY